MKNDLLSVELLIDKHIQVVFLFLNVDGNIDAGAVNRDRDGLRVVLILKEQSETLTDLSQLHWNESELDLGTTVTVDFSCAFETDLSQELFEDIGLGRLVIVVDCLVCGHDQSGLVSTLSHGSASTQRATTVHSLAVKSFHIPCCRLDSHGVLDAALVLLNSTSFSSSCSITLNRSRLAFGTLCSALLTLFLIDDRSCNWWIAQLLSPSLLLLLDIIH